MASLFAVGYAYQRFLIQYAVDSSALGSILLTFGVALMLHNIMIWVFSPDMKNITPTYAFTSVKLGPIVARRGARQLPGGEPGPAELPGRPAEVLAARPRHPRHRPADAGGTPLRRERPARLCAHLRACRRPSPAPRASSIGIILPFSPADEATWTLNAFVVVVLGGVGSPAGALIGGLLLGVVSTLTAQYIGPSFPNVTMFLLLVLLLLVRPQGLLGNAFAPSR